jgi:hypothetical protein
MLFMVRAKAKEEEAKQTYLAEEHQVEEKVDDLAKEIERMKDENKRKRV